MLARAAAPAAIPACTTRSACSPPSCSFNMAIQTLRRGVAHAPAQRQRPQQQRRRWGGSSSRAGAVVVRAMQAAGGMQPELRAAIDELVAANKVVVFMKGTKQFPQCGFSNTVVQILRTLDAPFESVNILESDDLRGGMKEYSQWPTFPQVYIDGEFYGGCDIMIEAYQNGELQETLERVLNE